MNKDEDDEQPPAASNGHSMSESAATADGSSPNTAQPAEQPDRLAQPVGDEQPPRLSFPVIGIGASAGGLEAYAEFLQGTRADSGMAFVLIQHLSPKHESLLAELLAKHTTMPVLQVQDGIAVEPNVVYVIRPGFTMTLRDGHLYLGAPASERGHRRPVDDFFRSLAEEQRERAVAIVLSGTGSNGTGGAQAIKAVGGLCIAEDPQLAKFPSMPRSLIDAGLADFVLPPREMFEALSKYLQHPYASGTATPADLVAQRNRHSLTDVLAVLRTRGRHDFSGYKKQTLVRRIQRRMGLAQTTSMVDYARSLRQNAGEVTALADDMLIHVTGFFRDAEVWETLRERVIVPLVAERPDEGSIRAWVTACSSGEEAYTLAILLIEAAEAAGKQFDIKIFATDAAERSLGQARRGVFPGGIESDVRPDRLDRFFKKDDAFYHVTKELRELIVFAPQNLLQDPPFSRLDICTCRNLLIYLEPDVQRRVLGLMHFALREGGALVLGNSETSSGAEDLFEPIDKKRRIFRRIGPTRHGTVAFPIAPSSASSARRPPPGDADASSAFPQAIARTTVAQLANRALLDWHTPAALVVDRHGQIVFFHGRTERFLDQPRGEPTRELLSLTRDPLRPAVREAFNAALGDGTAARVRDGSIGDGVDRRRVEVTVKPLDHRVPLAYFLVIFDEQPEPFVIAPGEPDAQDTAQLAVELSRVRQELQSAVEELQTSNEEMKASNEEVTSVNEELQSTNEELETSKEELQSLNEELTTVNAQLLAKMDELERTGNDLSSLLSSTDIAVIFLDTRFRIGRFTPAAKELIDLIPADAGRPLSDLAPKFADPDLQADAAAVLEKLVPREREIRSDADRWYLRRIMPYRTADNRIDGVVVTFVDITGRRRAEASLRESVSLYRALTTNLPNGAVFIVDPDLRYRLAEGQALGPAGMASADLEGKSLREALPAEVVDAYEAQYRRALAGEEFRLEHLAHGRDFITHGVPLRDAAGKVYAALAVSYDITDRKQAEGDMRRGAARDAFRVVLADALRPLTDVADIEAEATRLLGTHLGVARLHYAEMLEDERLRIDRDYAVGVPSLAGRTFEVRAFGPALYEAFKAGRTVVVEDVAASQAFSAVERRNLAELGITALVGVPLLKDGRFRAAIGVHSATPRRWTPEEVMLIEETAERIWAAADRARAAALLRESEQRLRMLLEGTRDFAIVMTDADGRIVLWNTGATGIFGFDEAEVLGQPAALIFTPEDRARGTDDQERQTARETGGAADERWHIRKDGSRFWGSGVMSVLRDDAGATTVGFVKVLHDATDRRRAEEAVRASEERLRLIVDNVGDHAIYLLDPHGHVSAWWRGAERLTGYTADEVMGRSFAMFSTPDDQARGVPQAELHAAAAAGRAEAEGFRVRKDGSQFWVNEVMTAIRDAAGGLIGFAKISRDLSERKRMEDALRVSEERSRIGIEAASMGSWDWDVANDVVRWDATHNRLLALPEGQAVGTSAEFMRRVHPDDHAVVTDALTRALAGDSDYVAEFRVLMPDGSARWIAGYGRAYDGEGGLRQRMIGVILDVTDRKESELSRLAMLQRERESRNAAEEANRVKDEFLATLSHELRTPLSAILIWAKLLRSREMTEANLDEGIDAIERSAQAQQQLINDLLDSSSIASGKLRLEMRETDLARLLHKSIDAILPTAEAKGVRVISDFAPDVGTALADANRLQQVIWNLLNNAVKFTPAGGRITVGLARSDGQVIIRCADTGRGISAEFLPHVFERFRQADASRTRSVGGLGLGLAIVKQLVEMHGGTIVAESPGEGLGATFIVFLPLRSVKAPRLNPPLQRAVRKARTAKSNAGLRGKTVLLVEDQDDARQAVTSLLTGLGIAVEAVAGADDALRAFERRRPDALLSDIGLPGKDGYALLREIRAAERASGAAPVPAIAITAFARVEDRRLAADAGYDRFVTKPFEPTALVALLRGLIGRPAGEP